ncbi:MAG: hypothetical protein BECKG1743F_GA0114225_103053 [Candidatus Kentron sp. G]|nr:MAG: hypothetical protein BECKG1743F_GA0114225_103053 [Candidatus Kentron sp. G]
MKIRRLDIGGFRSFHEAAWEPGAPNVSMGPDAPGKSNLLSEKPDRIDSEMESIQEKQEMAG